jgi:hypothetical protein
MRRQVARLVAASALVGLAVADRGTGAAAQGRAGPFEACLQAQAKQWIDVRVELIVNGDTSAGDIDDAAVAAWTVETINTCAGKAGKGDPAAEHLFARYMAHWREHIDAAATDLNRRARPD